MKVYKAFLQLHSLWFIISNVVAFALFAASDAVFLPLVIKVACYPVIFILSKPFTRRYNYYFRNIGIQPTSVFTRICAVDLLAFILVLSVYKLLT